MFRAVIVCNGDPPSEAALAHHTSDADLVIYTDGAAARGASQGHRIDVVIGDMDSIDELPVGAEVVDAGPHEAQHNSDSEKALIHAIERGEAPGFSPAEITVTLLGATGSRIDHSLANLQLSGKYASRAEVTLVGDEWEASVLRASARADVPPGARISLLALCPRCSITTTGLAWDLDGPLEPGTLGLSNVAGSYGATIAVGSGLAALIVLTADDERRSSGRA